MCVTIYYILNISNTQILLCIVYIYFLQLYIIFVFLIIKYNCIILHGYHDYIII